MERIARTKAAVGWKRMEQRKLTPRPVLGADTEVVLDDVIFGKPADADAARQMIARLSERRHEVITAVALRWQDDVEVALSVSHVTMRKLTAGEIERYVATGEPFDKAGGYAVQGLASRFVDRIDGSYSNVVGLPVARVYWMLRELLGPEWTRFEATELTGPGFGDILDKSAHKTL